MNQSSSSDLQFSKEKIKYRTSKYPELDRLSTETLIGIFEGLRGSAHVKKKKEMYFRDKSSDFQTNTESHYRDYFGLDYIAHFFLRDDGKIDLDFLIGGIPKEGEWVGKREGEEEGEEVWESAEDWIEKREREGYFDDDCDDECDDDYDEDYDFDDKDYDDDDNDVVEKNWNLIMMGKQFLLKFIEEGKIEADLKKASVQKAQWAIYNGGVLVDSILFLERSLFMNSKRFMKRRSEILEANNHEETQVWKILKDGKVSFQHKSADSPFFMFAL